MTQIIRLCHAGITDSATIGRPYHDFAFFTVHVRVGLEDSLTIGPGKLATSNAEQVRKIRQILEELGFEIANADEARARLQLKGMDRVGF